MEIQVDKKQYEDIVRFYDLIKSDSGIIEGFFLKSDDTKASRYYNDREKFVQEVLAAWTSSAIMHQDRFLVKSGKSSSENPSRAGEWRRKPETALAPFFRPSTGRLDIHAKVPYTR